MTKVVIFRNAIKQMLGGFTCEKGFFFAADIAAHAVFDGLPGGACPRYSFGEADSGGGTVRTGFELLDDLKFAAGADIQ